jgi:nicotinamide-nucleotide amidase
MDQIIKLFELLEKKQWSITTAESCTGGIISAAITGQNGSSAYFDRGYITYSNEAKIEMLGVNPVTIKTFGAVSEQCARLMARGAYSHSNADIAISVTGIAGPGGGYVDKPVGTVYIGLATADEAFVYNHVFDGDRNAIRQQTTVAAIKYVIDYLSKA